MCGVRSYIVKYLGAVANDTEQLTVIDWKTIRGKRSAGRSSFA